MRLVQLGFDFYMIELSRKLIALAPMTRSVERKLERRHSEISRPHGSTEATAHARSSKVSRYMRPWLRRALPSLTNVSAGSSSLGYHAHNFLGLSTGLLVILFKRF